MTAPAASLAAPPAPVFIVALPKSYTSVLSGMLGQHPGLCSVPELNLFVGETVMDWATQPGNAYLCDGLLRTLAQMQHGAQTAATVAQALAWLQQRATMPVAEVFEQIRRFAAPAVLIDQSPVYTQKPAFLQRILTAFPDARFIHMTRNPVSWLGSMAKWGPTGQAILSMYRETDVGPEAQQDPVALWHVVHQGLEAMLGGLGGGRYIRIAGEDTVTRTDATLTRLLDWLGLPCDAALLEAMHHPERSVFAGWGPPGARGGNNPDFLSGPALRTRNDREAIMRIDLSAVPVPPAALIHARDMGYV